MQPPDPVEITFNDSVEEPLAAIIRANSCPFLKITAGEIDLKGDQNEALVWITTTDRITLESVAQNCSWLIHYSIYPKKSRLLCA